jgi:hypothetical protein
MSRLKDEALPEYYFLLPDNEDLSEEGDDEAADDLTVLMYSILHVLIQHHLGCWTWNSEDE